MFAKYLLLVLWIITLVQGDDDQHDDTGCYPIVCDSDGCYVDYIVTETKVETYTPPPLTLRNLGYCSATTITTCYNCGSDEVIVTENVTSTIMTTLPDSTEFTTVVDTSTTQSTLTSCGHICTKSSGNPNSEDTLSSIGSSQSEV